MKLRHALVLALGLAVPSAAASSAFGQKGTPIKPDGVPTKGDEAAGDPDEGGEATGGEGGTDVEMEDEAPPDDMEGTSENPDAPRLDDDGKEVAAKLPKAKRVGYPIEEVQRPLTLPAVTSEVGLDAGFVATNGNSSDLELGLRAKYAITRQWQLGLRYLIGGVYEDATSMSTSFNTGKAFGLDVTFLAQEFIAGHLTVPIYVDPVAVGITLGAPMKFRFANDKLAIVAGDDLLDINVAKFIPSLTDESTNEVRVLAEKNNTVQTKTLIHLRASLQFQMQKNLMIGGGFVQSFPAGSSKTSFAGTGLIGESQTTLEGFGQFSPSPKFDVFGRIGWQSLTDLGSFGLTFGAQFRI